MQCRCYRVYGDKSLFKLGLSPLKLNFTCGGTVKEFAQKYVKIASLMILAVENKITKLEMYEQLKESPVCPLTHREVWEMFPTKDKWSLGAFCWMVDRPWFISASIPERVGPIRNSPFSLYWYMRTKQYPILRGYTVWFLGGSSEETAIPTQLAHSDTRASLLTFTRNTKKRGTYIRLLSWNGGSSPKINRTNRRSR